MSKNHDSRQGLRSSSPIIYLIGAEPLFLIVFVPLLSSCESQTVRLFYFFLRSQKATPSQKLQHPIGLNGLSPLFLLSSCGS
ncbi:hypothetical protein [Priestia abyssalis]|uniref:hypothetical protein n=1 Tax=Priestia abyssalis TaxID=1221450 RepID=UPI00099575FE|nr:hypothetical protein [Priestia abyssalis]